ncbi:amidohydrolase [Vulcanisaeta souniana]|uniref:N-ethylammeline chlorohydrolase n=1 Tax=Vulcanisaeta souniana JCM 11219 TaxID=1293586 RepID=A0A830E7X0_9CREN|nr:amidohydrolase [Vulcanisaeta souniana]BDR91349.1 N-ethylammeline chlorohydrolase [Vulcanisaeta souniana JCM 11219]GGI72539.1 N-ethylammeline chlorohydrolase [Vulcanisaeta souniana JCM 11219]
MGYVLRNCDFVLTWINEELRILRKVDVAVENGLIVNVGNIGSVGLEEINCSGHAVIPGIVNAHTHTPMSLLRGFFDDAELKLWLDRMWTVERELVPEVIALGSELSIIEMIISGTAAFIDMYHHPDVTADIALRYGLRAALGPTFIDTLRDPAQVENELRNFVSRYRGSRLVIPIINVHSAYTVSKDTLLRARDLSNELDLPIQIHASETRDEVYRVKRDYGVFPVEYLNSLGLVSSRSQLIHLGWVTNWELNIITRANARVTHAPTSNMKLATAGHFPMRELMDMGVLVTLGTDGPASNNSLDMFREMKMAVLLQRHSYWDVGIKAIHAFKAATLNGYRLLGINGGCINKGCIADLVLLDLSSPRLQPVRYDNILSNIVYSADGSDVSMSMVNGRIIYDRDRDYELLRNRAVKIGEKLNDFIQRFL